MFVLSVSAIILTGSLLGSTGAFALEALRNQRKRAESTTDYRDVLGPAFGLDRVAPVRVTYRTAEVRKARLVLEDFSQPQALAA